MNIFFLLLTFVLGASGGSFVNSLVYRLNHNLAPLGRSFCDHCRHPLGVFDLIPVASYFLLGGHCRYCGKSISWELPWVELILGLLFAFAWWQARPELLAPGIGVIGGIREIGGFGLLLVVLAALVAVAVSDFLYRTIPDPIVAPVSVLMLVATPLVASGQFGNRISAAVLSWLFFSFVYLTTKRRGIGLGDASLGFLIGASLGMAGATLAFFLAFLTGAGVGVILVLTGKKTLKSQIAFGPFLAGAAIAVIFLEERLLDLLFPGLIL